jgi:hypothetical protein
VLSALNSLEKEISNAVINGAMVNLFVNACSDKLCILEKKVNTSVLKLCLKTFSQFTVPLDKIRNFCFNPLNKNRMSELDDLVADFDLHVDRIMQIGLFAISCSSDFARNSHHFVVFPSVTFYFKVVLKLQVVWLVWKRSKANSSQL